MLIALVANTRMESSEFHVEYDPPHTIELIKSGILATGNDFIFLEADENIVERLKEYKPDLVFNRAEGIRGESRESHIPSILEMLGIPYIGSNILTTAISLNKAWTKVLVGYNQVLTPKYVKCTDYDNFKEKGVKFNFPVILKPNDEGSSMGIDLDNVLHDEEALETKLNYMWSKYNQEILVEEFIEGREFSVGLIQKKGGWTTFPILEIDFSRLPSELGNVFGQYAKTLDSELDYCIIPPNIDDELRERIEQSAIRIAEILEVRDFARIDFRLDKVSQLYFLEINPLPGLDYDPPGDFSFYPLMAIHGGLNYDEMVAALIQSALMRYRLE